MSPFIGKEIKPADNADVFDTITPLWANKENLSETERALVYAIAVLSKQITVLSKKLEEQKQPVPSSTLTGGARKNNSLRKKSSKSSKSNKSSKKSSKK